MRQDPLAGKTMIEKSGGISSETVKSRTGKSWDQWFTILDEAGAEKLSHKEIVRIVAAQGDVSGWWQQSVTVAYEQARGLREKHEKPEGYEISKSKTIHAGSDELFEDFVDEGRRSQWLGEEGVEIRTTRPTEGVRLTWPDGSAVEVRLYEKGEKTQVVVQHSKLPDSETAAQMKEYWNEKLENLAGRLSTRAE